MRPIACQPILHPIQPKSPRRELRRRQPKNQAIGGERHPRNSSSAGASMDPSLLPTCAELFHTAVGTAFADVLIDGHRETWPIRSRRFRAFLRRSYYKATGIAASALAIKVALDQLEARAQFD